MAYPLLIIGTVVFALGMVLLFYVALQESRVPKLELAPPSLEQTPTYSFRLYAKSEADLNALLSHILPIA
jgi:hypothetical protein